MANRLFLRLAGKLLHLWEQHQLYKPMRQPGYLDEITQILEDLRRAEGRWQTGWDFDLHLILPGLDQERQEQFQSFKRLLKDLEPFHEPPTVVPTLRDFLCELEQLQEEFGEVSIDWKRRHLWVVTEPIELEQVHLGSFSIRLRWEDWSKNPGVNCVDIVALDPNPAGTDEDVTHPHVKEQKLCAGDATHSIKRALAAGQLAEAFLLVRSVLTTYNSGSAHVHLEDWAGTFCPDCGDRVDTSELYSCEGCDAEYCDSCTISCKVCDSTRCFGCSTACSECEERCCPGCLLAVGDSDQECCTSCATTCPKCNEVVLSCDFDDQAGGCKACLADSDTSSNQSTSEESEHEAIVAAN
jgi:hypothetical protein